MQNVFIFNERIHFRILFLQSRVPRISQLNPASSTAYPTCGLESHKHYDSNSSILGYQEGATGYLRLLLNLTEMIIYYFSHTHLRVF